MYIKICPVEKFEYIAQNVFLPKLINFIEVFVHSKNEFIKR